LRERKKREVDVCWEKIYVCLYKYKREGEKIYVEYICVYKEREKERRVRERIMRREIDM